MTRSYVLKTLRQHEGELKAAGVLHLSIFGSIARGDSSSRSDVDLLVDFDKSKRLTLVTVGRLQSRLTDMLGANVDLSSPQWMKEPIRREAISEAILAF